MYFLKQLQTQFCYAIVRYQHGPEGPVDEVEKTDTRDPEWAETDERTELEWMLAATKWLWDRFDATRLAEWERNIDGIELPTDVEVSDYLVYSDAEWEAARALLEAQRWDGEEVTDTQIREHILATRLAALETNTISDGDREVIESAFINSISEEMWVDPETLRTLRALGFDGAQAWTAEETAENLRTMAQSLLDIRAEMEAQWIPIPEDRDEFLAMYDYLMQTGEVEWPLTQEEMEALGIRTEVLPNGEVRIDPRTPGYTEMPNGTVMWPPGAPYSSGWQVYTGRPSEISPDAWNITYDTLTEFQGWGSLSEAQRSEVSAENAELIEARFPEQWYDIAIEFCNTEWNIDAEKPIALASCPNLIAIVSYPGEPPRIEESPIAIGRNGYGPSVRADHDVPGQRWDARTQTGRVQHFHNVTIAGPDRLAGWSTMTGAIIRSPEWQERWGRWWHGGRDGRFPGQNSLWCVVAPDEFMIRLAEAVNRHGGGYGFQSEQATGEAWPTRGPSETPVA